MLSISFDVSIRSNQITTKIKQLPSAVSFEDFETALSVEPFFSALGVAVCVSTVFHHMFVSEELATIDEFPSHASMHSFVLCESASIVECV